MYIKPHLWVGSLAFTPVVGVALPPNARGVTARVLLLATEDPLRLDAARSLPLVGLPYF